MYRQTAFGPADKKLSEDIRRKLEEAEALIQWIPACRNRSLALTHLEDAMLRADLAISESAALREG